MANNTNFSGWSEFKNLTSGGTPYSFFNNRPSRVDTPNPTLTSEPFSLYATNLDYTYTYVVVDCSEPLIDTPIYYNVGSMTELVSGSTYSFKKLSNPSVTVCGTIDLLITPPTNIDYEMVNEYDTCEEALTANAKYAVVNDMLDFGEGYTLLVDNKYEIGDIFYVDIVFDFIGGPAFIKTAVQIDSFSLGAESYPSPIIPYQPYESVTEAVVANGIHYQVTDTCETNDESHYPLIHKEYYDFTTILLPGFETIPCKGIVNVVTFAPYYLISGGTEEIFSVVEFEDCDECLTKMGKTGILDTTLYNNDFNGFVYTMVEQPDGKILVGGNFNEVNGTELGSLVRLNSDGTLDTDFNNSDLGFNSYIRAIDLQPDGKILVGGNFHYYNDEECPNHFVRLNSDGSLDETFNDLGLNNLVRAIAVQGDGKIVVGGEFDEYGGEHYSNRLIRVDSNGIHDDSFDIGDGFNGAVFTINIETILNTPFYNNSNDTRSYIYNIIVGGWFSEYKGIPARGIVKLSETGELSNAFGIGFNDDEGEPRVNQIFKQSDGKLIVIGGATDSSSSYLNNYQGTGIGQNIVRLEEDGFGNYQIDTTFDVISGNYGEGGFQGSTLSVTQQPDGKLIIGGDFDCYWDNNDEYCNLYNIVRINTDGSYDPTFSMGEGFDGQVNKVLLLSDGKLLTGGRYSDPYPTDYLTRLYIGEEYKLYNFTDCNGDEGYTYLPRTFTGSVGRSNVFSATPITYNTISTDGLDLVYDGNDDDDDYPVTFPTPFDITFLGVNYTSVNVSTNPYITFGDGGTPDECCFDIPNDIPNQVELPGVFLSFACPQETDDYDSNLLQLYTGLTDGGNTLVIKYIGTDHCDEEATLVYGFKFYRDISDYFDLIIESNTQFLNDDPTGGVSNGVDETWVTTFDSTAGNAYRIGYSTTGAIKANLDETPTFCGSVGSETETIVRTGGQGGSMYFDGISSLITIDNNSQMDLNFGPWTVEWFQKYTSTDTCCRRVFDIGQFAGEEFGVSIENDNTLLLWMASGSTTINLNTPVYNVWTYFAISSENTGGNNQVIRVYQDGVLIWSGSTTVDINNFQGDPTVNLPLVIGGGDSGQGTLFEGYITNFRWTKGVNYYTGSNIAIPTSPLSPSDSQLLLLSTNEAGLIVNSSEGNPNAIPSGDTSSSGVTWSELNPFASVFSLYNAEGLTSYDDCDTCESTVSYKTTLYVRDGISNYVERFEMTSEDIANVLTYGPIFTIGYETSRQNYEILHYNL